MRAFIGMTSYYRRFIRNSFDIVEPLIKLTRKCTRSSGTVCYIPGEQTQHLSIKIWSTSFPFLLLRNLWNSGLKERVEDGWVCIHPEVRYNSSVNRFIFILVQGQLKTFNHLSCIRFSTLRPSQSFHLLSSGIIPAFEFSKYISSRFSHSVHLV